MAQSARFRRHRQDIRLPRVILGVLIGAALAVSGAVMQGLFRNPLADPGLVGVSAGASLGAVSVIVLGATSLAPLRVARHLRAAGFAAFVGGLIVTLILYRYSTRRGQTSVATMLLAGIALSALAMALTGILVYLADDRQLRDLTFWELGSLAGATWVKSAAAGPIMLVGACRSAVHGARPERAGAGRGDRRASRHTGAAAQTRRHRRRSAAVGASVAVSAAASASSASSCRICCGC
jgi:iron complex transport system permease protein